MPRLRYTQYHVVVPRLRYTQYHVVVPRLRCTQRKMARLGRSPLAPMQPEGNAVVLCVSLQVSLSVPPCASLSLSVPAARLPACPRRPPRASSIFAPGQHRRQHCDQLYGHCDLHQSIQLCVRPLSDPLAAAAVAPCWCTAAEPRAALREKPRGIPTQLCRRKRQPQQAQNCPCWRSIVGGRAAGVAAFGAGIPALAPAPAPAATGEPLLLGAATMIHLRSHSLGYQSPAARRVLAAAAGAADEHCDHRCAVPRAASASAAVAPAGGCRDRRRAFLVVSHTCGYRAPSQCQRLSECQGRHG